MKRLFVYLAGIGTLGLWSGAMMMDTPTQVIHQTVSCPTKTRAAAQNIQVIGSHRWAKGVVVLYSALCPSPNAKAPMERVFGHQVIQRQGMNWQISSIDSYGTNTTQKASERLIEYGVSQSTQTNNRFLQKGSAESYTILYGQILTPKVTTIEATFNNGQTLRDLVTSGTFALVASGASRVCELRILGSDNQILRQEELFPASDTKPPHRLVHYSSRHLRCLPKSQHLSAL
jgi:hypothetical protein